jgi:DNA-binding CsgD family transcriptional regulator
LSACFYFFLLKRRKEKRQIQEYEKRLLRTELEKKVIEEENLQNQIQLKTVALSKYSLHLSQKNKILHDISATLKNIANRKNMDTSEKIKVLSKEIDQNLKHDQDWHEFVNYFSDIHPNFVKKLSTYPKEQLSPAELRLGMLLRLNLNSKEIAAVLRVTPDSIRVARHRLRKKLGIEQKEKLVHFLLGL